MKIKELKTKEEIASSYEVVGQLYQMEREKYLSHIKEMMEVDYRLIGVFDGDMCLAVVGFRVGRRLYCGKYLHIDNMVVGEAHRGKGLARMMVSWMKEEAKKLGCDTVLADTYVDNSPAQKFFISEDFYIRGFHLKYDF